MVRGEEGMGATQSHPSSQPGSTESHSFPSTSTYRTSWMLSTIHQGQQQSESHKSLKHIASFLKRAYKAFKYTKMLSKKNTRKFNYFWETLVLEAIRSSRNDPEALPCTGGVLNFDFKGRKIIPSLFLRNNLILSLRMTWNNYQM